MTRSTENWRIEIHCHTSISSDSSNHLPHLIKTAHQRRLDRLAITDHNTILNALRAREMDPDLIIVGEEIKTSAGELLALFVTQSIPKHTSPLQAVQELKEQGAFICLAHPFDRRRSHWTEEELIPLLPYLDAVEVFNSRCFNPVANRAAWEYAQKHHLPMLVGSDAHSLLEVGLSTVTLPPFHSADQLRRSIKEARLHPHPLSTPAHMLANFSIFLDKCRSAFLGCQSNY